MIAISPGSIVTLDLGDVPNVVGHEQAKVRPCLVVKNFSALHLAIVLPFTSQQPSPNFANYSLKVNASSSGLERESFILCHQIRVVSHKRIIKHVGTLDNDLLESVRFILTNMLMDII